MRPVPAGRQRGQCCTPYSRLQEEIDNVETIAVTANNTANNAANAANTAVVTANSAMAGLTDGSVTKIGTSNVGTDTKPIKLVGGVPTVVTNELMDLVSNQTAAGTKKFTGTVLLNGANILSDDDNSGVNFRNEAIPYVRRAKIAADADGIIELIPGESAGGTKAAKVIDQRAYDPANTDDIATIGTLDAYTPMVRTTGNQNVAGLKTFTDIIYRRLSGSGQTILRVLNTSGNSYLYSVVDNSSKIRGSMNLQNIITGDHATRNIINLTSDDYSTTDQTGATANLIFELLPNGNVKLTLNTTKGDGSTASTTIATLTP